MRRAPREVATFELRKKASWWPERKSMPRLWVCCVLVAWVSSPGGCAENVMSSESGYLMRQHSLAAPYQGRTTYVPTKGVISRSAVYTGTGLEIPYWAFGGASVVTSSYVRLTPDRQSKQGNLWNTVVRLSLHRPSLSLSLALSLTLLSLPHTHTHTHTPPPLPVFVQTAISCPQLGGGAPVQCTWSGSEPVWRRLCSMVHQKQGNPR